MPTLRRTISLQYRHTAIIVISMLYILMPCRTYAQTVLFQSDFENTSGDNNWVMQGGASDGDWVIGAPSPYTTNGIQMEIGAFEGNQDLVTGNIQNQDVDGGPTRARSPSITLPTSGTLTLEFDYYFSYYTNSSIDDHFRLEIRRSSNNALLRRVVNDRGSTSGQNAAWQHVVEDITPFAGETVYIRVQSRDISNGSKVEAAVDLVKISSQSPNNVQGQVFEDSDNDGVNDATEVGVGGVAVALYDANGLLTQTTTASDGSYSFGSLTQGTDYQIIFSGWGAEFTPSIIGADSKGPIIYVEAGDNGSFGLHEPDFVCSDDPYLIIPCYVEGVNGSVASEPAIVKVRSSADGHDFTGGIYNSNYQGEAIADYSDVGTVYGIAYQSKQSRFYASAFHKRYASYGPSGADAIYQLDLNGNILGTLDFDVLTGITNSTGGDVHDFTTLYNGDIVDLGSGDISFDAVGKRGFGDIEMSSNDSTMYVVNLFDRKIYALDVGTGQLSDVTIINSWSTPDPTGAGRHRPFGLAYDDGQVWLGSVDENGQSAYVHSLDLSTGSFTLELTIPLQFERQSFFGLATNTVAAPAQWNPWQTNTSSFTPYNVGGEIAYPQPMLSDIEFDASGDMVIGFRDRFGDQSGADKHFNTSTAAKSWAISQGDIMKACAGGSTFVLESGPAGSCPATFDGAGNAGPGGQEFYYWDFFEVGTGVWDPAANGGGFHWETAQGGLYQIDGKDYIISTAMDPIDDFSGGYVKFNNITGGREGVGATSTAANLVGGYTIYDAGDYQNNTLPPANGFAAKANGLGDIEGACDVSSAIGNYVWFDTNQDGLQMAGEPGLANVTVELYKDGVKIGEVITDSKGYYFFGGPNNVGLNSGYAIQGLANYDIRIEMSSAQANDGSITTVSGITTANSGDDSLDSDASTQGSYAFISITTASLGINDYSFDFGFTDCMPVYADNLYDGCQGDGYMSVVGTSTYDESNPSGIDTITSSLGCDSVVTTMLTFDNGNIYVSYLQDTSVCIDEMLVITGPPNNTIIITNHAWTDLGLGTSTGYQLSGVTTADVTIDPSNATPGSIFLEYKGSTDNCDIIDTVLVQVFSNPTANILSEVDTICSGASLTLMAEEQFVVQPDSGMVISSSGQGVTLLHEIVGVLDPVTTKIIITLPTWDDHFDTMLVNGLMVLPEIFEQASYNAQGMNCQTPWIANVNGLPRSILEITSTEVKYFSSLTPNSTVMTQVFPTNWTTTPQPLVQGLNQLQFGIQNTAGPVSGSWFVEVQSEPKIYYEWSTGDTTSEITVNPVTTTTYMLTVTAPNGCKSVTDKTIYAGVDAYEDITYQGCSGDGYAVSINGNLYDESNPSDTLSVPTVSGCDSIYYISLTFAPPPIVEAGDLPAPLCSSDVLTLADLQASITGGITTGDWTSAGGGVFDNSGNFGGSNPATTYTPSASEINDGKLILTLTSDDPPGSCEPEADAVMVLINDIRCSSFPWSGGQ